MILKGNIDLKSVVLISWLVFVLKMILLNGGDSLEHARYLLRLRVTQKKLCNSLTCSFFSLLPSRRCFSNGLAKVFSPMLYNSVRILDKLKHISTTRVPVTTKR